MKRLPVFCGNGSLETRQLEESLRAVYPDLVGLEASSAGWPECWLDLPGLLLLGEQNIWLYALPQPTPGVEAALPTQS